MNLGLSLPIYRAPAGSVALSALLNCAEAVISENGQPSNQAEISQRAKFRSGIAQNLRAR